MLLTTPVPEMTPATVFVVPGATLNASVALSVTFPGSTALVVPSPICRVPPLMVVPPVQPLLMPNELFA